MIVSSSSQDRSRATLRVRHVFLRFFQDNVRVQRIARKLHSTATPTVPWNDTPECMVAKRKTLRDDRRVHGNCNRHKELMHRQVRTQIRLMCRSTSNFRLLPWNAWTWNEPLVIKFPKFFVDTQSDRFIKRICRSRGCILYCCWHADFYR
jgi:hypothetical protein